MRAIFYVFIIPRKTFFYTSKVVCVKIKKNSEVSVWKDICRYFHAWKNAGGKMLSLLLCMYMESSIRHANVSPHFTNNSISMCLLKVLADNSNLSITIINQFYHLCESTKKASKLSQKF